MLDSLDRMEYPESPEPGAKGEDLDNLFAAKAADPSAENAFYRNKKRRNSA